MKRMIQMSMMLCVCLLHMHAQPQAEDMPGPRKNSIFLEGFGNGIVYSLNYDHLFSMKKSPKIGIGARMGISIGTYQLLFGSSLMTTLPAEAYFSYGLENCLELGLGYTSIFEGKYFAGRPTARLGYRFRGPGGFMLGAGAIALIETYGMWLIPQLSVGLSF